MDFRVPTFSYMFCCYIESIYTIFYTHSMYSYNPMLYYMHVWILGILACMYIIGRYICWNMWKVTVCIGTWFICAMRYLRCGISTIRTPRDAYCILIDNGVYGNVNTTGQMLHYLIRFGKLIFKFAHVFLLCATLLLLLMVRWFPPIQNQPACR